MRIYCLVLSLAVAVSFCVQRSTIEAALTTATQEQAGGVLRGRVGTARKDGSFVPAESATVYVLYAQPLTKGGTNDVYGPREDTAGNYYQDQNNKVMGPVSKEIKALTKNKDPQAAAANADKIAELVLRGIDQALAATRDWAEKHPKKAWQIRSLAPDAQGVWAADNLQPGSYEIVIRGTVAGRDLDWEASVDLHSGKTISLPLDRPRFFRMAAK